MQKSNPERVTEVVTSNTPGSTDARFGTLCRCSSSAARRGNSRSWAS